MATGLLESTRNHIVGIQKAKETSEDCLWSNLSMKNTNTVQMNRATDEGIINIFGSDYGELIPERQAFIGLLFGRTL